MRRLLRPGSLIAVVFLLAAACTGEASDGQPTDRPTSTSITAEVVSSDLVVDDPQRFLIGLRASDGRTVSFGELEVRFAYLGTAEAPREPQPAGDATARYLPTPGSTEGVGSGPTLTSPSQARGVYQADRVRFDRVGFWQVDVDDQVAGLGALSATSAFQVFDEPQLPFPGERALPTENLTMDSKDAPLAAVDSRAEESGVIPDPELHEWTIREALQQDVPALVVFATPVWCESQFCGPVTDEIARLQARYSDRAAFIHVEIWRDNPKVINVAAADWLLRNDNLTEPWTYLIGADGRIVDRWGVVFDEAEITKALERLPTLPRDTIGSASA